MNMYERLLSVMRGSRAWFWLGLLLVVAATASGVILVLHDGHTRDSPSTLVEALVPMLTAGAGAVAWLWTQARPPAPLPLERAADELATQLREQWAQVAAERGLIHPAPIPVRWRWSCRQVAGPPSEAVEGTCAPLPGMAAVTVDDLRSGTTEDLFRVYAGLGSGRLIVLGEPGAGKSGAGIRLLRDALDHRAALKPEERARVPVPVLVTPQGWDPTVEPFAEWLARRLRRDYILLRAPEYGGDTALRLIKGDHLTVIFDGLDEMPQALRSTAMRALHEQVTFRLVVLSRTEELVPAVRGDPLHGAAVLELLPVGPKQAAEYLASSKIDPLPPRWQYLIDHLRQDPDGALARALDTPLTLTLVRDTYGRGTVIDEPITIDNKKVTNHLLDQVLAAAYTRHPGQPAPPYTRDQAQRWLGRLAHRMNEEGTRDLTWWQIPRWVPAWPRAFFTVVAMSVVCAFIVAFLGLAGHIDLLSTLGVESQSTFAAAVGKTLGYAFMFGPGLLLASPPGGRLSPRRNQPRWTRTDILMILLAGTGVGIGAGIEKGIQNGPQRGLAIAVVVSFVVGLGFFLGGGPPQRLGPLHWSRTEARADLRANLPTGFVIGLVAGVVTGVGYGVGYELTQGLVYGSLVAIGYMLVIVVGGRPPRQESQLRWRIDTPAILLIGLVIAIASGAAGYGITYVLVAVFGGRLPLIRSRLRWSRTATPTTLLTGLFTGLILGLVFGLTGGLFGRLGGKGLEYGLMLGLVFGLMVGLLLGLRQPPMEATNPVDPRSLWRRELQLTLGLGLVTGLVYGLVVGLVFGLREGLLSGLTAGFMIGVGSSLVSSATWAVVLASAQLRRRNETPARLLRFLDDARQRQIVRTVGPVYQFRHARLQDRLAEVHETTPGTSGEISNKHDNHIPAPRRSLDDTQERIVEPPHNHMNL
jgi:hypothetical protein